MVEKTDIIQATSKERKTKEITVGDITSGLESRVEKLEKEFGKKLEKIEKYLSKTPPPPPKPAPKKETK